MTGDGIDLARRRFLRGGARRGREARDPAPIRPPWSSPERFAALCTRCGACGGACPEGILQPGDGGFPEIRFGHGECSFCGACADACPAPLFDRTGHPWTLTATIGADCLGNRRIVCRSCRDACPESAIRIAPAPGGLADTAVDAALCTGCGACVAPCPTGAVAVRPAAGAMTGDRA
ncbi:ferredoxin-type protein NapF [Azospirillum thermophilum]|uniref:Ferredoxin-type protein NapF n=1 Tax=Azospirillum thermophilum TaxID=2202148 RepID=A0A2S2CZR8_9PROT|nr:ferredoxin-type protein NapF [Azospirillum thermophilum]AWK89935.1 ferredoxin-type protein NapF [Azospirillum thermophilum]